MFNLVKSMRDNISKVYIGKVNTCRCGCAGDYYYADGRVWDGNANDGRGAYVQNDVVAQKKIKTIFNRVMKCINADIMGDYDLANKVSNVYISDTGIHVDAGSRSYGVYFD